MKHIHTLYKMGALFLVVLSLYVITLGVNNLKEFRFIGGGIPSSNVLTVSGSGEVVAVPDVARFTFTIEEERTTVEDAQKEAAEKINAITEYLDDKEVEEEDIETTSFTLNPRYEYERETIVCVTYPCPQPPGERVLKGYTVRQTVEVTVRDTDTAGDLLAGITNLGATYVSGLNFTIDDVESLQEDARSKAIEDAQKKAKKLARDLDVSLVRVVNFSEHGGGYAVPQYARSLAFEADDFAEEALIAPDIPVGEQEIVSNVSITYEIR